MKKSKHAKSRNSYSLRTDFQDAAREIHDKEGVNPSKQVELALKEYFKKYPYIKLEE